METKKVMALLVLLLVSISNLRALNLGNEEGEITFTDIDGTFTSIKDTKNGSRTLPSLPFSAFVVTNQSVSVNFHEAIGEITVTISTLNGQILYQTLEHITSPQVLPIFLSEPSNEFLLIEIKNCEGAYASGTFLLTP